MINAPSTIVRITIGVMGAFALVPMFARRWRTLFVLAALTGLLVSYFWARAILADWDKNRMIWSIIAVVATTGLLIGLGGAAIRLAGRQRNLWLARFPVTEILAAALVLTYSLAWWTYL